MHEIVATPPSGAPRRCHAASAERRVRCGRLPAALLVAASAACASEHQASPAAEGAREVPVARVMGPVAQPEWEHDVTHDDGATLPPTAFRAGHGLVAVVFGPSRFQSKYALAERGARAAGGPHSRGVGGPASPATWELGDVAGIARTGHVWFLDRETGSIVGEDVGGFGHVVARLGARGTVRTACAIGERAVAFLDDRRPGRVFVRDLASAAPVRAVALPPDVVGDAESEWTTLRFGGSTDGACVLRAPRLPHLLVVGDSSVRALGPFVEPLSAPSVRPWYARLLRRGAPADTSGPVGAMDATSFPGGVAVLFGGRTADSARLVDLYDDAGRYLETMRLPRPTRRIAAANGRLVTLAAGQDSVWLASYVLPARVRVRPVVDQPEVIAPDAAALMRALPADTARR